MRIFIKSFLFTIFLLLPKIVIAEGCGDHTSDGSTICETYYTCKWESGQCVEKCPIDSNTGFCVNYSGCYTDADFGGCSPCEPGTYNNTNDATSCQSCSSFSYPAHRHFDSTYNGTYGLDTCPWVCANNYFDDVAHTECFACPLPSSGFMSYRADADISHISTCSSCNQNQYIIQKDVIINNEPKNVYYCGTCGFNIQPTETGTGTNVFTCTCPANTNHSGYSFDTTGHTECICPDNAHPSGTTCVCNDSNKTIVLDNETGLYVCSSCSNPHATLDGNVCKCNEGYYGTINGINTQCTQCPSGTTTNGDAEHRNECYMDASTKFCYGSDDNKKCMNLIPAGTFISAPNNT